MFPQNKHVHFKSIIRVMNSPVQYCLKLTCICLSIVTLLSCNKDWLDVKPDKSMVVLSEIEHYQALMDHDNLMTVNRPGLGIIGSDLYYVSKNTWNSIGTPYQIQSHIWGDDIYGSGTSPDWNANYQKIYYANLVLKGLEEIQPDAESQSDYNRVKGSALFFRAMAFHDLVQLFAKPYDPATAATDPGIPLRLNTKVLEKSTRASVEKVYQQVINDLKEALVILPLVQQYYTRPTATAATALLARVYLSMEDYEPALEYANQALIQKNDLMNYNTAPYGIGSNFTEFNDEVIYHGKMAFYAIIDTRSNSRAFIDSLFYQSYDDNDLRKERYFNVISGGRIQFRGDYSGDTNPSSYFGGLATDELYLIKAECLARLSSYQLAMDTLNYLLSTRWREGFFSSLNASDEEDALRIILTERKKSLIFRGLRWSDLRRLNRDPRFAQTLTREFDNGEVHTLEPSSIRYVWPIPPDEIALSGIEQNPR